MRVLVTGCGRGGTNLGIEVIRCLGIPCTVDVEDRKFFQHENLPPAYATKLATENNGFTVEALQMQMDRFPDLKILFMLRHPYDNVMSKILRGQPKSMGGDNETENIMPDGTVVGASEALLYMHKVLDDLISNEKYSHRLIVIKMEDLCTDIMGTVTKIADFLNVKVTRESLQFYKYNRNHHHQKRYRNELRPQVNLFFDLDNSFDGFFADKPEWVNQIKEIFSEIAIKYDYVVSK